MLRNTAARFCLDVWEWVLKVSLLSFYHLGQLRNASMHLHVIRFTFSLTEGLHRLHQLQGEGLVLGQLFEHAGDLIMPRADDVASVDALHVVAHTDHLHFVHHAALFDALPCRWRQRRTDWRRQMLFKDNTWRFLLKGLFRQHETKIKKRKRTKIEIQTSEQTNHDCEWLCVCVHKTSWATLNESFIMLYQKPLDLAE